MNGEEERMKANCVFLSIVLTSLFVFVYCSMRSTTCVKYEKTRRHSQYFASPQRGVHNGSSGKRNGTTNLLVTIHNKTVDKKAERKEYKAKISFGGTQRISLYVNGKLITYTTNKSLYKRVVVNSIKVGDVLVFRGSASIGRHAFIADIHIGKKHFVTGKHRYRVCAESEIRRCSSKSWKLPGSDACGSRTVWKKASMNGPDDHHMKGPRPFADGNGAEYIWAKNSNARSGDIFIRYIIGGSRNQEQLQAEKEKENMPTSVTTMDMNSSSSDVNGVPALKAPGMYGPRNVDENRESLSQRKSMDDKENNFSFQKLIVLVTYFVVLSLIDNRQAQKNIAPSANKKFNTKKNT